MFVKTSVQVSSIDWVRVYSCMSDRTGGWALVLHAQVLCTNYSDSERMKTSSWSRHVIAEPHTSIDCDCGCV